MAGVVSLSGGLLLVLIALSIWLAFLDRADSAFSQKNGLSHLGELIASPKVRLWVLGVLCGVTISAMLLIGNALAIYAATSGIAIWVVLPLLSYQRVGQVVFVLVTVVALFGIGILSFIANRHAMTQLMTPIRSPLPNITIGPVHLGLANEMVVPAALWLNVLAAVGVLLGVLMSVWNYVRSVPFRSVPFLSLPRFLRRQDDDSIGVVTIGIMGLVIGSLLLGALSALQHLNGFVLLYRALAITALGWLLIAYAKQAVVNSFGKVEWKLYPEKDVRPISYRETPDMRAPSASFDGPLASLFSMMQGVGYFVTLAAVKVAVTLVNVLILVINLAIWLIVGALKLALSVVVYIARFLGQAMIELLKEIKNSTFLLYRWGTSGLQVSLYTPALCLAASMLLAICAVMGVRYLGSGDLRDFGASLSDFAGAAISLTLAAALYADWAAVRSFLNLLLESVGSAIFLFSAYVDVYGISRVVFHAPSHFGKVSLGLNIIAAAVILLYVVSVPRGLGRRSVKSAG